jgi:hypothetical protein
MLNVRYGENIDDNHFLLDIISQTVKCQRLWYSLVSGTSLQLTLKHNAEFPEIPDRMTRMLFIPQFAIDVLLLLGGSAATTRKQTN